MFEIFRSVNCCTIVGRIVVAPRTQYTSTQSHFFDPEKLPLKIERTTQKKSHWLFFFLLCIASTFTLVIQGSIVADTIDLDEQESSISIVVLGINPL